MTTNFGYHHEHPIFGDLNWEPSTEMLELYEAITRGKPQVRASTRLLIEQLMAQEVGVLAHVLMVLLSDPRKFVQTQRIASLRLRELLAEIHTL